MQIGLALIAKARQNLYKMEGYEELRKKRMNIPHKAAVNVVNPATSWCYPN